MKLWDSERWDATMVLVIVAVFVACLPSERIAESFYPSESALLAPTYLLPIAERDLKREVTYTVTRTKDIYRAVELASKEPNGATVVLRPRTYLIRTPIEITNSNVRIDGGGGWLIQSSTGPVIRLRPHGLFQASNLTIEVKSAQSVIEIRKDKP